MDGKNAQGANAATLCLLPTESFTIVDPQSRVSTFLNFLKLVDPRKLGSKTSKC